MSENVQHTANASDETFVDPINSEALKERSYTNPFENEFGANEIIPEPSYVDLSGIGTKSDELENPEVPASQKENPEKPSFNDSYSELDSSDKKQGAKLMAEAILDGYSSIIGYGGKFASISESKLDMKISSGEINPSIPVYKNDEGKDVGVREFVKEYNEEIKEAFLVSEDFKEKVTPPLMRVLQKRGAAMTDEQLLMYYFGKDVAEKGISAFSISQQNKQILNSLAENTLALKAFSETSNNQEIQPEREIVKPTSTSEQEIVKSSEKNEAETNNESSSDNLKPASEIPSQKFETPTFGDPSILEHMGKVSENGNITKKSESSENNSPKTEKKEVKTIGKKRGPKPKDKTDSETKEVKTVGKKRGPKPKNPQ